MNQDLINLSIYAANTASKVINKYYNSKLIIKMKSAGNPVTDADCEADNILHNILSKECPEFGWLSEETKDSEDRLDKEMVWIVDPLDGTKEFVEGIPNFVISIGLVKNGIPVLGTILNPISNDLYSAYSGNGVSLNGSKTSMSNKVNLANMIMLNSRSETKKGLWKPFNDFFNKLIPIGSIAYKLAKVSVNQADIVASLKPKNEWDICAGHCLINEAGGAVLTSEGEEITYNNRNTLITPGLVASNKDAVINMLNCINNIKTK